MGCCSSRNLTTPEDHLVLIENSFGFHSISAADFDNLSHKFNRDMKVSIQQFEVLCKKLKIDEKTPGHAFLMLFYDEKGKNIDTQILTTIGILFGSGEIDEKLNLLFKNYDIDISGIVDKAEINKMVSEIITISIDYVCMYSRIRVPESYIIPLNEYANELKTGKSIMISVYTMNILKDRDAVTFAQFAKEFRDSSISILLSPHKIRTIGQDIIKNLLVLAKKANLVVENDIKINTSIARRLSARVSKKQRRKELKKFRTSGS